MSENPAARQVVRARWGLRVFQLAQLPPVCLWPWLRTKSLMASGLFSIPATCLFVTVLGIITSGRDSHYTGERSFHTPLWEPHLGGILHRSEIPVLLSGLCCGSVRRVSDSTIVGTTSSCTEMLRPLFWTPLDLHGHNQDLLTCPLKSFKDFLTIWTLSTLFRIFEI